MIKPIVVFTIASVPTESGMDAMGRIVKKLEQDYHVVFLQGSETKAQVFVPSELVPTTIEGIKEALGLC